MINIILKDLSSYVKCYRRSYIILSNMIGKTFLLYNGKTYKKLIITNDMIGRKLGEFFPTRKMSVCIHFFKSKSKNKKRKK